MVEQVLQDHLVPGRSLVDVLQNDEVALPGRRLVACEIGDGQYGRRGPGHLPNGVGDEGGRQVRLAGPGRSVQEQRAGDALRTAGGNAGGDALGGEKGGPVFGACEEAGEGKRPPPPPAQGGRKERLEGVGVRHSRRVVHPRILAKNGGFVKRIRWRISA